MPSTLTVLKRQPSALQVGAVVGTAALAAAFAYVWTKTRAAEKAHPPAGKFINVDGVRLHYLERGAGPAVVLLHGNGVTSQDFELSGVMDQLAASHRVIAFDRPGFGYSARPDGTEWTPEAQASLFYQALHALQVERPVLVGHSWGTLVTAALALDFPKYVRGIVMIGGYYYPSPRVDAAMAALANLPVLGTLWRYTGAPLLGRLLWPAFSKQVFSPMPIPARFRQLPPWLALRPSQLRASAAESGLMVPAAKRLCQRYGELIMPVALIAGDGDKLISPRKNSLRLHQAISHSALQLESGAGHMAHYAAPERVVAAVAQVSGVD